MSTHCHDRFKTWISQTTGGDMLGEVVVAELYDDAQSQLAALREELATLREGAKLDAKGIQFEQKRVQTLEQRLAAAEQRNAELIKAATGVADHYANAERERGRPYNETYESPFSNKTEQNAVTINVRLLNALRAALKPTESGASE